MNSVYILNFVETYVWVQRVFFMDNASILVKNANYGACGQALIMSYSKRSIDKKSQL